MTEQEQELRPEEPKKEFIITAETANLVAAIGNNEAKAITLGTMQEGIVYSQGDFYRTMISLQGRNDGWRISYPLPFTYCKNSLAPIGLVTREVMDQYLNTWGYTITPFGEKIGKALAGHLLSWSLNHPNFSLYKMFGVTSSSSESQEVLEETPEYKRRAPEMRLKIFYELTTNPSAFLRETDLEGEIEKEKQISIENHLRALKRNGVINYEWAERGKPSSLRKLNQRSQSIQPKIVRTSRVLSHEIHQILQEQPNKYFSIDEITRILKEKYPKYQNKKKFEATVSTVLAGFDSQGLTEHKKFKSDIKSEISVTDEQRKVIVSLLRIINRFQSKEKDFVIEGRRLLDEILVDPEKVAALMKKAREASPNAGQLPQAETCSFIILIVKESPGTQGDIQNKIEEYYGRKLSLPSVARLVRHLLQQGKLKKEKIKGVNVYSVVETEVLGNQTS